MSNKDLTEAYMNFFKDKAKSTSRVNKFIEEYQQLGGGYIDVARIIRGDNITSRNPKRMKEVSEIKDYVDYLKNTGGADFLANKTGIPVSDILKIDWNKSNGEPNQKWHLMVSYLGMILYQKEKLGFQNKAPCFWLVSCPELWIWMFEVSGIFSQDTIAEIYDEAVRYRKGEINCKQWKAFIKLYRLDLHEHVMNR